MRDYSVKVTYAVGRCREVRGYVVRASSQADAERKGRAAHQQQGEPGTPVVSVRTEQL